MRTSISNRVTRFLAEHCGLEPVIEHFRARQNLLGIASLPIRTVLDVGAGTGIEARSFCRIFPEATVYCFEPISVVHTQLASWAARMHGRVRTFPVALGNDSGLMVLERTEPRRSLRMFTGGHEPQTRRVPVYVERLDDMVQELELYDDIFVKLNAAGQEADVVAGGRETLQRAVACTVRVGVVGEGTHVGLNELMAILGELGYRYGGNLRQVCDSSGRAVFAEAVFLREVTAAEVESRSSQLITELP